MVNLTLGNAKLQHEQVDNTDANEASADAPSHVNSNWNNADANLQEITLEDLSEAVELAPLKDSLIAGCGPLGRNYTSSSIYESIAPVEAVKVALDSGAC